LHRRCPVSDIAKHMSLYSHYLSGRKNAKYKCLVLDLDLAARTSDRSAGIVCGAFGIRGVDLSNARQGTPAFMSCDLLPTRRRYQSDIFRAMNFSLIDPTRTEQQGQQSMLVEDVQARMAFERAFSSGAAESHGYTDPDHLKLYDEDWLPERLEALHKHFETTTFAGRFCTEFAHRSTAHQLRHDIESCFWGMCRFLRLLAVLTRYEFSIFTWRVPIPSVQPKRTKRCSTGTLCATCLTRTAEERKKERPFTCRQARFYIRTSRFLVMS